MPRRDKTGPMGQGSLTGRGLGLCQGAVTIKHGTRMGLGRGRGFGSGIITHYAFSKTRKELLQEQKDALKSKLETIDKQLENL